RRNFTEPIYSRGRRGREPSSRDVKKKNGMSERASGVASRYCESVVASQVGSVMCASRCPLVALAHTAPHRTTPRLATPVARPIPTRSVSCTAARNREQTYRGLCVCNLSGPGRGVLR
ncbi:unnamed protein product, partial [Laminaria digitata]